VEISPENEPIGCLWNDRWQYLWKWINLQWLIQHPQYLENILYIGGDSYSGIPLPIIVQEIFNGKEYSPSFRSTSAIHLRTMQRCLTTLVKKKNEPLLLEIELWSFVLDAGNLDELEPYLNMKVHNFLFNNLSFICCNDQIDLITQ